MRKTTKMGGGETRNTNSYTRACVYTQTRELGKKELESIASLDPERQAVAIYQGHF